jgi:hypothetical protein
VRTLDRRSLLSARSCRHNGSAMAQTIKQMGQLATMLLAPRAITVVSVAWSPFPRKSRDALAALESTQEFWSPKSPIEFFDLWPEEDETLNSWYDGECRAAYPKFELHGHGYGPIWWLANGKVLDCLTGPYNFPLGELQERSKAIFGTA